MGTVQMWKDFTPHFGDKRAGCCIMITHCLPLSFSAGYFLTKKEYDCHPLPTLLFSVSPIEDKTEKATILTRLRWNRR
jgi:hypothetical protein